MKHLKLFPIVLLLTVAGCDVVSVPYSHGPVTPATTFDGAYRSGIVLTSWSDTVPYTWCQTPGQPIITVANGEFNYAVVQPGYPVNVTPSFQAAMSPNGAFAGLGDDGTGHVWHRLQITGYVQGTHMEGRIYGANCTYAFAADRM
jgi:hypothetical protein